MQTRLMDAMIDWARLSDWRSILIQFLAGCSLVFSFAPFGLWFFIFPGLILFAFPLRHLSPANALKHGLAFGFGYFGAGMSWVHVSVYEFGQAGIILSALFTIGFVGLLACFPALVSYLLSRYFSHLNDRQFWLLAWPASWMFSEWVRSWLFTGLPWLNIGQSQIDGPLSGILPVLGANAASLWVILLVGLIILIISSLKANLKPMGLVILVNVVVMLILHQQQWIKPGGKTLAVTLIQPDVAQELKWEPETRLKSMRHLYQTTDNLSDELIIWPEAAVPALADQVMDYLEAVDALAEMQNQTILTGIPVKVEGDYYNAVQLYGLSKGEYHKRHLVPFGEYVPYENMIRGLIPFFDMPMSSFSKGVFEQPRLQIGEHQVALAICYEIIFQSLVAQQVEGSDFLVTLSNDAWFGESYGPYQHLELARLRAKESGIPVIRGTNDGISAFIDADGTSVKTLSKGEKGLLSHELVLYEGKTPYRVLGPFVSYLIVIIPILIGLAWCYRREQK